MTLCNIDSKMVFTGDVARTADDGNPIPRGWIVAEPPEGDGVWQWGSDRWVKLDKYPEPPPPPAPSTMVDRLTLVQMLAKTGKGEALGALLKSMSTADREEWYARQQVDLADPRVQKFLKSANIELSQLIATEQK
jgi:hypothetical protein